MDKISMADVADKLYNYYKDHPSKLSQVAESRGEICEKACDIIEEYIKEEFSEESAVVAEFRSAKNSPDINIKFISQENGKVCFITVRIKRGWGESYEGLDVTAQDYAEYKYEDFPIEDTESVKDEESDIDIDEIAYELAAGAIDYIESYLNRRLLYKKA